MENDNKLIYLETCVLECLMRLLLTGNFLFIGQIKPIRAILRQFTEGKNFINNEFIKSISGNTYSRTNPICDTVIGEYAASSIEDTNIAINAAHRSFLEWKTTTPEIRSKLLSNLSNKIADNVNKLAECITIEMGKPITEAMAEVTTSSNLLNIFAGDAKRIRGELMDPSNHRKLFTLHKPHGVVGLITPWNFPLNMIVRSLGAALAAGCTVVSKPSPETPLTALMLANLIKESGFPPGVVNFITSNNDQAPDIGLKFCTDERVRHISFTGSTPTGKKLLSLSGSTVKRCSMELGGNAPFIVYESADIDQSIKCLILAKFRNAGQTCISPNRIYVHSKIHQEFIEKLKIAVSKLICDLPSLKTTQISCLYSKNGFEKVSSLVDSAIKMGAICFYQGMHVQQCGSSYFPPTILTNCQSHMPISQTEIFGPVCAIYKFSSDSQLMDHVNDTPHGLAGYVYSQNIKQIFKTIDDLMVGLIAINDSSPSTYLLPFGGHKESGIGAEMGSRAIYNYMDTQSVVFNHN